MLLAAVAGAILGSFLATLVVRWPAGRSLGGRSACDECGKPIGALSLIPLLSYAVARGRCADCNAPIDPVHPIMELASAVLAGFAFAVLPLTVAPWVGGASLLLLTLALLDLRHFWLPDRLTLSLAGLGLLAASSGAPGIADRLVGLVAGWASLVLVALAYRRVRGREGLGAGDGKLFGAIGAWTGWQILPFILLGASVLGLAVAAAMLVAGRRVAATTRLPFGTLLAAAALPAIYWTALH
ncbi:Prepilin leader peptidase/N-methyltransferase [Sphingomonas antarctica]|uniref:prepilin peptidase n=1 Tax=Sphingomonas antarctica TaxID=2040274 RepID=UPI0039E94CA4